MTDQDSSTPPVYVAPPAPPAVLVAGRRTTVATGAGVVLIVLGVLGALVAAAIFTIGRGVIENFDLANLPGMEQIENPGALISGVFGFIGILLLVFSVLYVIGGIGVLRTAGWGRVIGVVVGIIGTLFWLPAIAGTAQVADSNPLFAYVLLAAHLYAFIALAFFWRAKPSLA